MIAMQLSSRLSAVREYLQNAPRRYVLVGLCALSVVISYADRSNIAIAIVPMAKEYGWDESLTGGILSSFFYGYLSTQVLGGYLADRIGGKSILAIGALLWSVFTLLTPLATQLGIPTLILCRIALGLGEGVAFPAIHSLISRFIPPSEQSRAVAAVTAASYLGAVFATVISAPLAASSWRWPSVFYFFGIIGAIWNIPWHFMSSSTPKAGCFGGMKEDEVAFIADQIAKSQASAVPGRSTTSLKYTYDLLNPATESDGEEQEGETGLERPKKESSVQNLGNNGQRQGEIDNKDEPDAAKSAPVTGFAQPGEAGMSDAATSSSSAAADACLLASDSKSEYSFSSQRYIQLRPDAANDVDEPTVDGQQNFPSSKTKRRHHRIPWRRILRTREVWAILSNQFLGSWGFYILLNWLPTYYSEVYDVDIGDIGWFTVTPYVVQGLAGILFGILGDHAIYNWRIPKLLVRRMAQCLGMIGPGIFLLLAAFVAQSPFVGMFFISCALGLNSATLIGVSVSQLDIAPKYAGVIFGLGNTAATIPGMVGVYITGLILKLTGSWPLVFTLASLMYFTGAVLWLLLSGADVVIH